MVIIDALLWVRLSKLWDSRPRTHTSSTMFLRQKDGPLKNQMSRKYLGSLETSIQKSTKGKFKINKTNLKNEFRKSVTHTSKACVELVDDEENVEGTQYVSHFSFPLDFQMLAQTEKLADRPYLLLQVNSIDAWSRHRVEGYGFVRFPSEPGYHKLEVETWRPRGSLTSEIHSFFLGGSIRIHKLEEIIRTKFIDE